MGGHSMARRCIVLTRARILISFSLPRGSPPPRVECLDAVLCSRAEMLERCEKLCRFAEEVERFAA